MELLDLYTDERIRTGMTADRSRPIPEGFYVQVVHICVFDTKGRMLIQQRQPFKKGWPGMWGVSVGGCAVAGETSRNAAERETLEELGLEIDLSNDRAAVTVNFDHGFDDYYVLSKEPDLSMLKLQPEEVQAVRWADEHEILKMIDEGIFIPYEKSLITLLFTRRNNRSAYSRDR